MVKLNIQLVNQKLQTYKLGDQQFVQIQDTDTIFDVKLAISELKPKLKVQQIRLTLLPLEGQRRGQVLENSSTVKELGIKDGQQLVLKNLGPQIGYQTVFILEYLGPFLIYPIIFTLSQIYYTDRINDDQQQATQILALLFWEFHYGKRLFETYFVHKFSHATMPIANLYKNCSYYWLFAAYIAYYINHPLYTPPNLVQTQACLALAMTCELINYRCHTILSSLRSGASSGYQIPRGFFFDYITCPNYTFETLAWILFAVGTQSIPALIFAILGGFQMAIWAIQKHKRLRKIFDGKDFNEKYPKRYIMIPPFF